MRKVLDSKIFKFIWSAGLAAGIFYICPPCLEKWITGSILVSLLLIINLSHIIEQYVVVTHIFRFLVGGLFIFSGFIKANDTIGFSYKLEEYFEVFKGDFISIYGEGNANFLTGTCDFFHNHATLLAGIICVSEMILGFMLLIGFKRNLTLWLLLAQIIFFTFLTFYSACYNKVTHCGCFGDFLKLEPWESFWKDIILLVSITILFAGKENINPFVGDRFNLALFAIGLIAAVWFPIHTYRNLPVFDFRDYAPGKNICEQMVAGPNYKPAVYESVLIYKNLKTGKDEEFNTKNYPWKDTLNYKWVDTKNKKVKEAENAPTISDLEIKDLEGNTITDSILKNPNYNFLIISYDVTKASNDKDLHNKINEFYELATKNKIKITALSASSAEQINTYKHDYNALYDFANADGVVLKTMIRSNPGLILMKDCKVIANWHYNNFPNFTKTKELMTNK